MFIYTTTCFVITLQLNARTRREKTEVDDTDDLHLNKDVLSRIQIPEAGPKALTASETAAR